MREYALCRSLLDAGEVYQERELQRRLYRTRGTPSRLPAPRHHLGRHTEMDLKPERHHTHILGDLVQGP